MNLLEEWLAFLNGDAIINGECRFGVKVLAPVKPAVILADPVRPPGTLPDPETKGLNTS